MQELFSTDCGGGVGVLVAHSWLVAAVPGLVLSNQLGDLPVSRSVVLTGCIVYYTG